MKLYCGQTGCMKYQQIVVRISGPHTKASCSVCSKYIKFLDPQQVSMLENEDRDMVSECNDAVDSIDDMVL